MYKIICDNEAVEGNKWLKYKLLFNFILWLKFQTGNCFTHWYHAVLIKY